MTVTLDREAVTSQQTFDSYIGELTDLTLGLINDVATERAHGAKVSMTADEGRRAVNAAFATDDRLRGLRRWRQLGSADASALAAAARRMRAAIDAAIDGDLDRAAGVLNALLAEHHAMPNLHGAPGQIPTLAFHSAGTTPLAARVAEMSTGLAMIIGTGRLARLGRCSATQCDRLFYDVTRNNSRRFCDLSCQNRTKASAFRARRGSS
jgi:predicted RNA-binding Zn ribbon-like protein